MRMKELYIKRMGDKVEVSVSLDSVRWAICLESCPGDEDTGTESLQFTSFTYHILFLLALVSRLGLQWGYSFLNHAQNRNPLKYIELQFNFPSSQSCNFIYISITVGIFNPFIFRWFYPQQFYLMIIHY